MDSIIETTDISFAAFLRVRYSLPMIGMRKDSGGRVTWGFQLDEGEESDLVNEFYAGAPVSAVQYASELKSLKSALYNL